MSKWDCNVDYQNGIVKKNGDCQSGADEMCRNKDQFSSNFDPLSKSKLGVLPRKTTFLRTTYKNALYNIIKIVLDIRCWIHAIWRDSKTEKGGSILNVVDNSFLPTGGECEPQF